MFRHLFKKLGSKNFYLELISGIDPKVVQDFTYRDSSEVAKII